VREKNQGPLPWRGKGRTLEQGKAAQKERGKMGARCGGEKNVNLLEASDKKKKRWTNEKKSNRRGLGREETVSRKGG